MIGPFEFGKCYYQDCIEGMKQLPDQSIELCLTDPPYNVNFKGKKNCSFNDNDIQNKIDRSNNPLKLYYEDKSSDFMGFIKKFLIEAIRICNFVILTPGHNNLYDYILMLKPSYYIRFWYKPNDMSYVTSDPILIYGKSKKVSHLPFVFRFNMNTVKTQFHFEPVHPCPKLYDLWHDILKRTKPESVLDPFLGSGTTAHTCEALGIKWLGFEIEQRYSIDINKRIELGKKAFKIPGQVKVV